MSKAYRIRRYMDLIQPSNYGYEPFTSLYCRTRPNGILMPRGLGIVVRFCSGTRMPEVPVKGEWKIAFTQFSLPSWLGGRRLAGPILQLGSCSQPGNLACPGLSQHSFKGSHVPPCRCGFRGIPGQVWLERRIGSLS